MDRERDMRHQPALLGGEDRGNPRARRVGVDQEPSLVAEAAVPRRHPAFPLEITLSVRDGVTCWLEFGPHDGGSSLRPPVEEFRVIPQFESI